MFIEENLENIGSSKKSKERKLTYNPITQYYSPFILQFYVCIEFIYM